MNRDNNSIKSFIDEIRHRINSMTGNERFIMLALLFVALLVASSYYGDNSYKDNHRENNNESNREEFIPPPFHEVDRVLGIDSPVTDLKQREMWDALFKGRRISWVGKVEEVRPTLFGGAVVTIGTGRFLSIQLHCAVRDKKLVSDFSKGDRVRVVGIAKNWVKLLNTIFIEPVHSITIIK